MKATHTQGPWVVNTVKTSIGHCHKIEPIKACIYVDHRHESELDLKTTEAAANAALIASAPDLLAALERIANGEVMSGEWTHAETVLAYQQIARKALARA